MDYGPMCGLSSGLSVKLPSTHEYYHVNAYRITQIKEIAGKDGKISGLFYDTLLKNLCPDMDGFVEGISSYAKMPLRYGYFVPQRQGAKKPLIIFLHGMGEGGEDTAIAYSGNKVVSETDFRRGCVLKVLPALIHGIRRKTAASCTHKKGLPGTCAIA